MPTPYGRDRVLETGKGALVLSCLRPKGWSGRPGAGGPPSAPTEAAVAAVAPGTAVEWEGVIYEVVRVEDSPSGGTRYTLEPWDERQVIRKLERYGAADPGGNPGAKASAGVPPATLPPSAGKARALWERIPLPIRVLLLGFVPGVLLSSFCGFHLMGEGMSFFVHELGHTAMALAFGRFAVPAVVLTITFEQSRLAAGLIWLCVAFFAWRLRSVPGWRLAAWAAVAIYPVVAFTPLQLDAFHLAGHLAEVIVAALFFHRAVRGGLFSEWERPVYAFFGWYLWLRNVRLFFGVATDAQARTDYLSIAIAGQNDLVKLANAHGLDLAAVAFAAFAVSAVIPAAGLVLALRKREAAPAG